MRTYWERFPNRRRITRAAVRRHADSPQREQRAPGHITRMSRNASAAALAPLLAAAIAVGGCGGNGNGGSDGAGAATSANSKPAGMLIQLGARPKGALRYEPRAKVKPGTTVQFRARLFSSGGQQARDVRAFLSAPPRLHLIGASELMQRVTVPVANADPLPGNLRRGIPIGPLTPRAAANLLFELTVPKGAPRGTQKVRVAVRGHGFHDADNVVLDVI